MKPLRTFLSLLLSLLFIISPLLLRAESRINDCNDLKEVEQLSDGELMLILRERKNNRCHETWLANDNIRHAIISRLDVIVEKHYYWWNDRKGMEDDVKKYKKDPNSHTSDIAYLTALIGRDPFEMMPNEYLNRKSYNQIRDSLYYKDWDILFAYLQVDQDMTEERVVKANISWMNNHHSLQYLSIAYQDCLAAKDFVSQSIEYRNNELIGNHLAFVDAQEFVHYKSNGAGRQAIKDIDLSMDNDLFTLGNINQDRDYTGGGALTMSTDFLPARWLNLGWIKYLGKNKFDKPHSVVMSYQSVTLGMNFYTPYIRYRNNFELADSLFKFDRPFASYVFVERSKYRLWPKGLLRHHGTLQLGVIGSNLGRDIQATLHRDATVESQKVYGWDKQIGQGGRWLVQLNHQADVLLFSTTNKYKSFFSQNWKTQHKNALWDYLGANIIASGAVYVGGYLTAVEGGIKIATTDFTNQSGQNTIKAFQDPDLRTRNRIFEFGINVEAGIRFRRVIHNSMLEGFGYFTTFKDDKYDDESESVYTLNEDFYRQQNRDSTANPGRYDRTPADQDQLNRNLWLFDLKLNLRWRRMTFYVQSTLHKKEYEIKGDDFDYDAYYEAYADKNDREFFYGKDSDPDDEGTFGELREYDKRSFYGFGKIGVVWLW